MIPTDGTIAAYYTQAITKDAPDPAAARLWEEYLYSLLGQNLFLQGYARPIELAAMTPTRRSTRASWRSCPPAPKGALTLPDPGAGHDGRSPRLTPTGPRPIAAAKSSYSATMSDLTPLTPVLPLLASVMGSATRSHSRVHCFDSVRTGAPVVPFLAYITLGLLIRRSRSSTWRSVRPSGKLTLANITTILAAGKIVDGIMIGGQFRAGFENSLKLALVTSIIPGVLGTFLAYAIATSKHALVQAPHLGLLRGPRAVRRRQPGLHVHRRASAR